MEGVVLPAAVRVAARVLPIAGRKIVKRADVLLLAGDLTERGTAEEARCLANELSEQPISGRRGPGQTPESATPRPSLLATFRLSNCTES